MKPLILVGGGGHCKSVIEAAESTGRTIKGILDLPEYLSENCLGYQVIGTDFDIPKYVEECEFIVTLGFINNPEHRIHLHSLIEKTGGNLQQSLPLPLTFQDMLKLQRDLLYYTTQI